jgi:hypothetical protein
MASLLEDKIVKIQILIRDKRFEIKEIILSRSKITSIPNGESDSLITKQNLIKSQLTHLQTTKVHISNQLQHHNELLGITDPNTICGCCVNFGAFDLNSLCLDINDVKDEKLTE